MTKVFIAAPLPPRLDATDLLRHGQVIPLLEHQEVNYFKPQDIMDLMEERFKDHDFDPEEDIIAISGDFVLIALMMRVASDYEYVKIAIFRPQDSKYYVSTVS